MTFRVPHIAAVLAAALLPVGTSGCASSGARAGDGCSPALVHASRDIARAGDTVMISATAVACRLRFTHDRELTLSWRDRDEHEVPIGTVRATPAGAFEEEVRVPEDARPGDGGVVVDGFDDTCADTGSCAASEAAVEVVDTEPDFGAPGRPNQVASVIAVHMLNALRHRPTYVEVSIVPDGVKLVLRRTTSAAQEEAVVERAFAAGQEAVPEDDRSIAAAARLHVEFIRHDGASLNRLMQRISADRAWQKANRIELSTWGPDPDTDSVRVGLRHYSDAAAIRLTKRYGEAITVSPRDHGLVEPL